MEMMTSDATDLLDAALAKAQGQVKAAVKDKENAAFSRGENKSTYADLTAVWAACREALSGNGISVTQWPLHSSDGRLHMITRMAHAGQWIAAHFSIPVSKTDAHGYGSAMTYARRFCLAAAVGVVADIDDDGNQASGVDAPAGKEAKPAGGAAGRGGDTVRARRPAPRPAAGNPSPPSVGGTPPDAITEATMASLTDACKLFADEGGDPVLVVKDMTGKRTRKELTEDEARKVQLRLLELAVQYRDQKKTAGYGGQA